MTRDLFLKKLKILDINKKDFSNISKVPYSTLNNWGTSSKGKVLPIPPWVEPFLTYYQKAKNLDYLTDEICNKIKKAKE